MVDTPQAWAARNAARLVIYLLLAVILVTAFFVIKQWREDAKAAPAMLEQRDAIATATGEIAGDLTTATEARQRVEVAITTDTRQLAIDLETLRRANPDLDHWLDGDIPGELQQLAAERQRARDRLGAGADGSQGTDPGAPAAR